MLLKKLRNLSLNKSKSEILFLIELILSACGIEPFRRSEIRQLIDMYLDDCITLHDLEDKIRTREL
jgi:hypothetical protein